VGYFIGKYFDGSNEKPLWSALGAFIGLVISLSVIIMALIKGK